MNPPSGLEVSTFVSKSTACALTACEHVFAIDHDGRVSCIACACDVHSTFKDLIVAERARPLRVARGGELPWLLTTLSRRGCAGITCHLNHNGRRAEGAIISVQNGEHSFCSKRRHDEEKSFNGHSFLPATRGASSAEPPFFWSLGIRGRNQ